MRKILLCLLLAFTLILCVGCNKNKNELTDKKELVEFGKKNDYYFPFNDQFYYHIPSKAVVVGLAEGISKGKVTVCTYYYHKDSRQDAMVPKTTINMKAGKTYTITLNSSTGDVEGEGSYDVLQVYDGYDIYIDFSMFVD